MVLHSWDQLCITQQGWVGASDNLDNGIAKCAT